MTTLELQLKKLKSVPAAQSLAVHREHASLLFTRKEAASFDREEYYNIGLSGLLALKKFDNDIDEQEAELFDKNTLFVNRANLLKDEHETLNEALERMIIRLSPYFHHEACKKVFEWLIYKYQIHIYNAEALILAMLPYHSNAGFGRLLAIVRFEKPEWDYFSDYKKEAVPVPLNVLVKFSFLNGNHFLISALSNYLVNAIRLIGEEYASKRLNTSFTFFACLVVNLFEDIQKVDNQLISRIMPYVGMALKSKVAPFKFAGIMIVAKISVTINLNEEILNNILKLLLLKMKKQWVEVSLETVILICQTQTLTLLPKKPILKLIRKSEELELNTILRKLNKEYETTEFLTAFWTTHFECLKSETIKEQQDEISLSLVNSLGLELLTEKQAIRFFTILMNFYNEFEKSPQNQPFSNELLSKHIRNLVIRFSLAFDAIRAEWLIRDESIVNALMKECQIEEHEVGQIKFDYDEKVAEKSKSRKRKRTRSEMEQHDTTTSEEDPTLISVVRLQEPNFETNEQIKNAQEEIEEPQKPFKKRILKMLEVFEDNSSQNTDRQERALKALNSSNYLQRQSHEHVEEFFVKMIQKILADDSKNSLNSQIKSALSNITLSTPAVAQLLSKFSVTEPRKKRLRSADAPEKDIWSCFANETNEKYFCRVILLLEIFNNSKNLFSSTNTKEISDLIRKLFDIIDRACQAADTPTNSYDPVYCQELCLSLTVKLFERFNIQYANDFILDTLVKVIRFTQNSAVLRKALKMLTLVATSIPAQAVSQFMSLFTFMGDGILKRDNEITLSIFEETLYALFGALLKSKEDTAPRGLNKDEAFQKKIVEISRVFAISLMDIPAHRRIRILRAVSSAIPKESMWIVLAVLFQDYCVRWDQSKMQDKVENLEDIALELFVELEPEFQLNIIINFLDYLIYLGGDEVSKKAAAKATQNFVEIFDRNSQSIRNFRHYRFVILGFIHKCLSNRSLYEKFAKLNDEEIYSRINTIGQRLLPTVMYLTDFVDSQLNKVEQTDRKIEETGSDEEKISSKQALKYWVVISSRADFINNKLRCLLPANVSGRIICNLLDDGKMQPRLRDRALELINKKLSIEPLSSSSNNSSSSNKHSKKNKFKNNEQKSKNDDSEYLKQLTIRLNTWLQSDDVLLCQQASFSLKLLSRRLMATKETARIFEETLENCVRILNEWKTLNQNLIGNILLLVAELIRSQKLGAVSVHSPAICQICLEIAQLCGNEGSSSNDQDDDDDFMYESMNETIEEQNSTREILKLAVKGVDKTKNSSTTMGLQQVGDSSFLMCSLSCLQRLLDSFSEVLENSYESIILTISRLISKRVPQIAQIKQQQQQVTPLQLRLTHIRQTISKLELGKLIGPFSNLTNKFIKRPSNLQIIAQFLEETLKRSESGLILKSVDELVQIFTTLFSFRSNEKKLKSFESTNECEDSIISAFIVLCNNLSENDLTPIIQTFSQWVESTLLAADHSSSLSAERFRILTIYKFANKFYESFNTLALPHFDKLLSLTPKILQSLNAAVGNSEDENTKLIDGSEKESLSEAQANQLIILVISFISKCAKHSFYFDEDRAKLLYESVLDELENTKVGGHEQRCLPHLADCLFQVAESCPDLFANEICSQLLEKIRNKSKKVKLCTLSVFQRLLERNQDIFASLMPLIEPVVAELNSNTENTPKIQESCATTIRMLRERYGMDLFCEPQRRPGKKHYFNRH